MKYCDSVFKTKRWKTREVLVGNIGVGGDNPLRIQSMTTSSTRDVQATVEQIIRLADVGCEIARVTVQGMKEADACEDIKNELIKRGYTIPLVADIHLFPPAAMRVVDFVDKVRVNPGNYVDKRASFKTLHYNDVLYAKEIEKIEEKFLPLVEKCKKLKRAMRIGTNHGSLSDRIMNRYGDTPQGMVESALEFARVCRKYDYHDFMFSMKSSNPQVMILAYRLLVAEMMRLGWDYPLHLGVTEAGEGEDGRIKSAIGIGSLLLDGIGDTIRVSLTEDAWNEIDPCKRLINFAKSYENQKGVEPFEENFRHFESLKRREVVFPKSISMHRDGTVVLGVQESDLKSEDFLKNIGCEREIQKVKLKGSSADMLVVNGKVDGLKEARVIDQLREAGLTTLSSASRTENVCLMDLKDAFERYQKENKDHAFKIFPADKKPLAVRVSDQGRDEWAALKTIKPDVIFLSPAHNRLHYCRQFFDWLQANEVKAPVILNFSYLVGKEDLLIQSATECGVLLCDGLGEGVWLEANEDISFLRTLSFNILQACRMRAFKTDFISCPSCGRTLFDLQDVSKSIRERTSHLPGVKIAIMGCIVNGPGEMADADFGYVGSKPGMIDLYVGKQCVEKDILFSDAVDRLIDLIKKHDRWVEPEVELAKCRG